MDYTIAVLPGDGIGPEVTNEAKRVLNTIGDVFSHRFNFMEGLVGGIAIDETGIALPEDTIEISRQSDSVLFGAVGGPKWDDPSALVRPEDGIIGIRKALRLYANIRPVVAQKDLLKASPIKEERLTGVDFVVIRELTGGLYFAKPKKRWTNRNGRMAVDTLTYSEKEVTRILKVAYDLARTRRHRVTSVDKANVLESSRLWREICIEIAAEYPDVETTHILVDACAMQLIQDPGSFDVIVTENMFGDILTDEASVLAGSMGLLPSASLGVKKVKKSGGGQFGLYEPIHGTAPDIAGKNAANPLGSILSAAMLLRLSLGLDQEAQCLEQAVARVISERYRTPDIFIPGDKIVTTTEMGQLVVDQVYNR